MHRGLSASCWWSLYSIEEKIATKHRALFHRRGFGFRPQRVATELADQTGQARLSFMKRWSTAEANSFTAFLDSTHRNRRQWYHDASHYADYAGNGGAVDVNGAGGTGGNGSAGVLLRLNTVRHRTFWISCHHVGRDAGDTKWLQLEHCYCCWWWGGGASLWLYCNTCWLWLMMFMIVTILKILWRTGSSSRVRCSFSGPLLCQDATGMPVAMRIYFGLRFWTFCSFQHTGGIWHQSNDSTTSSRETVADCHIVVKNIQLHVALLQQMEGHAWKSETRSNKRVRLKLHLHVATMNLHGI